MNFFRKLLGRDPTDSMGRAAAEEAHLARLRDRIDAYALKPAARPVPLRPSPYIHPSSGPPPRPVVLARKPRERDRDWTQDKSWFGGLPKLGGAPWPRSKDGRPLPFAAQISLAEVASACPESPLPHEGCLAFFLGEGAVVYVPNGDQVFSPAPEGLPLAYSEGSYPFPERPSHTSRQLFPFWPVEPIGLPLPEHMRVYDNEERHEQIWELQRSLLAERVRQRAYSFSVYSARKEGIEGADRLWWYGAIHIQQKLRDALDSLETAIGLRHKWIEQARDYQARLAASARSADTEKKLEDSRAREQRDRDQIPEIRRQADGLEALIDRNEDFVAGRQAWVQMTVEDIAVLEAFMREARDDFPDLTTYHIPARLDDVRDVCIRRMITGNEQALAALPNSMLAFLNENYRLTSQSPHQMFGLAGVKQDNLYAHLEDLLLLQLSYDDMNEWRFGDMGLWHFWISPADAAAGRWERSTLTFECA